MSRPAKPWALSENENSSSFNSWKNNIIANLKFQEAYKGFVKEDTVVSWQKLTSENPKRGFTDENALTTAGRLNEMLCYIASYAPSFLSTNIQMDSTSLDSVWEIIKVYYRIDQSSEVQFMKILLIVREPGERPQRLYQRILSHLQDNLLQKNSKLKHNGETPQKAEVMSPTVERLAVLRWMELIHPRIPEMVQRTFAYDLQRATLKDLQPQISDALDGFLKEISDEETKVDRAQARRMTTEQESESDDNDIAVARTFFQSKSKSFKKDRSYRPKPKPKQCVICKIAGKVKRSFTHSTSECEVLHTIRALQISEGNDSDNE